MDSVDSSVALRIAELRRQGQLTAPALATILMTDHSPRTACELTEVARVAGVTPVLSVSERRHVSSWTYASRVRVEGRTSAQYFQGGYDDV